MTERVAPAHVLPVPRWTLIIHLVQAVLAIIILGLSAYGIRWIAYNALIFALVVCLCTLGVCAYLLVSQLFIHKIYNMYIVLGVHAWMILFWIIDLGLVSNLARIWSGDCYYYYGYGYACGYSYSSYYYLAKREETTRGAYYGALAAGAFFAAAQFGLFVCGLIITVMFMNKHRAAQASAQASHIPPPQYVESGQPNVPQPAAVPMEKYNYAQQNTQQYPQSQPSYSAVSTPQTTYAQPAQGFTPPPIPATYQHEPIARGDTVSPISNVGYPTNATELNTPQHTGNTYSPPNANAAELNTPSHTGHYSPPNANAAELNTPQHTGHYSPPTTAAELSTPQHAGHYNPNASELSAPDTHYNPNVSELPSR